MSAYIVPKAHIDVVVSYFASDTMDNRLWYEMNGKYGYMSQEDMINVAYCLYDQNLRSVNARYSEQTEGDYLFSYIPWANQVYTVGEIAQALRGLEYQSCETEDYYETDAYKILTSMRKHLLGKISDAEEVNTWCIDEPKHKLSKLVEV